MYITTPDQVRKIVATEVYEMIMENDYAPNYEEMISLAQNSDASLERLIKRGRGQGHGPWHDTDVTEWGLCGLERL